MKAITSEKVSRPERIVSLVILLLLAGAAFALRPHRPFTKARNDIARGAHSHEPHAAALATLELPGFEPAGPPEFFRIDTVYEKIDGKIEFYEPLGFLSLAARRWVAVRGGRDSLEIYIFDLGSIEGAFAALTLQRRTGARQLPFSELADLSENSAFFAHDRFYVEVVGASDSPALVATVTEAAARLADLLPGEPRWPAETAWFPRDGLLPESLSLSLANGFGFEKFHRLFLARYQWDGSSTQVFIHPADSPEAARALLDAWCDFLKENGARPLKTPDPLDDIRVFDLFGSHEIVFVEGRTVAGAHQAGNPAAAMRAVHALREALREIGKP